MHPVEADWRKQGPVGDDELLSGTSNRYDMNGKLLYDARTQRNIRYDGVGFIKKSLLEVHCWRNISILRMERKLPSRTFIPTGTNNEHERIIARDMKQGAEASVDKQSKITLFKLPAMKILKVIILVFVFATGCCKSSRSVREGTSFSNIEDVYNYTPYPDISIRPLRLCDSVIIYYYSPINRTFFSITPENFIEMAQNNRTNKLVITNKDTLDILVAARNHIYEMSDSPDIDTRFMTIFYNRIENDTLFFTWLTPDIVYKNRIYEDSIFVNSIFDVIKLRDPIFPFPRVTKYDGLMK